MCSIYCCLVAFLWNLIKRTGSATFSTQQNHTVYSARGETRGEFESGLVSEGMRPFHRCVTQIKPDRKVPVENWESSKRFLAFCVVLQMYQINSYLPHFPCYTGFLPNGPVVHHLDPRRVAVSRRCLRPAESSRHLLLVMDWLDDCVIRFEIQWLPGSFNQLNQSAVQLMGRLVNAI